MAIRIGSWNTEGRLSPITPTDHRGSPEHILQGIEALDRDVLVLPEAYRDAVAPAVDAQLRLLGYQWHDVAYENYDREEEYTELGMPYMRVLSRIGMNNVKRVRWGDVGNLLVLEVIDPETGKSVRLLPTHLDDRSEEGRLAQIRDIIPYLQQETYLPTIMLGDFNAMWHEGRARLLGSRAMRFIARHIPHEKVRSLIMRLTDMATGTTLRELTETSNLRDVDVYHRPTTTPKLRGMTFMPSIRMFQIDHILITPDIEAEDFIIGQDGGSDHRSISTTITVRTEKDVSF